MKRMNSPLESALKQVLPKEARLLLAVSGGIDSMAMLLAAFAIARVRKLHIEVAHVDHRLRKTSARDAKLVEEYCKTHETPFHYYRCGVRKKGENLESWARRQRYSFFAKVLKTRKLDWIVTAHTANDAAETLLMKLFSNKELTGIESQDMRRRVLRPLLGVSRKEIEEYAKNSKLRWNEDESNDDIQFLRNRVRHRVLPLLEREFGEQVVISLAERAISLDEDIQTLRAIAHGRKSERLQPKAADTLLWRAIEARLADPLQFRLGRSHSKRVVDFLFNGGGEISLPSGVRLSCPKLRTTTK